MGWTKRVLMALGAAGVAGGIGFASLDQETRGLIATLPADSDVLGWSLAQRDAGFRAVDRVPFLVGARRIEPAAMPLALPAGRPLRIPGIEAYSRSQRLAGIVILHDGKIRHEDYGLSFDAKGRWTSFSVAKSFTSTLVGAAIADGHIASLDDPVPPRSQGFGV